MPRSWMNETARKLKEQWRHWSDWIRDHVPPGLRTLLGLVLIAGGLVGFLPILGFWMIPLGIAVVAMDVAPLWRAVTGRRETTERQEPSESETSDTDYDDRSGNAG